MTFYVVTWGGVALMTYGLVRTMKHRPDNLALVCYFGGFISAIIGSNFL